MRLGRGMNPKGRGDGDGSRFQHITRAATHTLFLGDVR